MYLIGKKIIRFLEENDAYLDCANDDINTTNANGKMISRILTSVSQNEIERTSERTKIGQLEQLKKDIFHIEHHLVIKELIKYLFQMNLLKMILLGYLAYIMRVILIKQ